MTTATKRFNVVRPPDYSAPPATQHGSSDTLGPGPARVLTDQIKVGVEAVWELVKQAYTQRAWSALGYASWDEYCTREFGTSRLRLPRKKQLRVLQNSRPLLAGVIAGLECRFTGGFELTCTPEIAAQYAKSLRAQGEQIIQISRLLQSHGETSTGAGQPA